jgi:fermentation-respiration switch protein FrsA (DUF1100 family)
MTRAHITLVMLATTAVFTLFIGCDLDGNLFNSTRLSSYILRTTVIPESLRTQVVLSSNGTKIYGYFVRSNGDHPQYCILYNHGNRDHMEYYWERVEKLFRTGCAVFVYDYRGFGMSEGTSTEIGIYADAQAAYEYLRSRGYIDTTIAVYGFSLGGAPANYLAADVMSPRALILESVFASTEVLARSGILLDIPGSLVLNGSYDNSSRIKRVHAPLLMMHGTDDLFIDMNQNGLVVFANANDPKRFIAVPGAGHSTVPQTMGDSTYVATVREFVLHPK